MNDNNKLNFKNEIGVKFNISRNNIIMIGIDNKKMISIGVGIKF